MTTSDAEHDLPELHEAKFSFLDEKDFLLGASVLLSETLKAPFTLSLTIGGNTYEAEWNGRVGVVQP